MEKYSSPYPSEVTYRSDKNFIVRLKAMIDRNMKAAGYSTSRNDDKFMSLIESIEDAEEYLFDESTTPSPSIEQRAEAWAKENYCKVPEVLSAIEKEKFGKVVSAFIAGASQSMEDVVEKLEKANEYRPIEGSGDKEKYAARLMEAAWDNCVSKLKELLNIKK